MRKGQKRQKGLKRLKPLDWREPVGRRKSFGRREPIGLSAGVLPVSGESRIALLSLVSLPSLESPSPRADERHWAEIGALLRQQIRQVWAFKPILNSARIRNQSGIFLAFGCGYHKEPLKPTFSLADYDNENAPSYGVAQIGYVQIAASAKERIREELYRFGMEPERVYPELSNVCQAVRRRYETNLTKVLRFDFAEDKKVITELVVL